MNGDGVRSAFCCGRPGCACQRGKQVHCPAHPDDSPSLSVSERGGRILVHCHAGCAQADVIEALRQRGLWGGKSPAPALSRLRRGVLEGPLNDVARFIERYVVLPNDHAVIAAALWVAHTYVLDAFDASPYLIVQSAEKRSGKTRLLEALELLTLRSWRVVQPSEAVLFRRIAKDRPTLLLDEGDTIFNARNNGTEPLRAILNAGNRRGVVVPRCVGEGARMQLVDFEVFGAKAVASIGRVPTTIEDRGIAIRMDRATPAEQRRIQRLRFKEANNEAAPTREALSRWATAALPKLREARPALPDQLDGRAADGWEPLLAVAEQAGDGWFVAAWEAALALSAGVAREDDSLRVRLLADTQRVFDERGCDRLATADLIEAICEDETSPLGDLHGRRVTPQALARLLRPFGIVPGQWRDGNRAGIRGYTRDAFANAWARYLPAPPLPNALEPLQPLHASQDAGFSHFEEPLQTPSVAVAENGGNAGGARVVAVVAVQTPPEGGEGPPAPSTARVRGGETLPPEAPCRACGKTRFWVSIYGPTVCATCHPPATPGLVARWWGCRPSGRWLAVRPVHQTREWRCVSPPEHVREAVRRSLERHVGAQGAAR